MRRFVPPLIAWVVLGIVIHFPLKLAEDAVIGWLNDQIADRLGITSPTVAEVLQFLWAWGVPALAAAAVLYAYHLWHSHHVLNARAVPQPAQRLTPYDLTVRQASEHVTRAIGAREQDAAYEELRQAARDGEITIWGRPASGHLSLEQWTKPLEPVAAEHWRDFHFDVLRCIFHEDERECRTEPDGLRSMRHDEVYVDLRANRRQIEARWPLPPAPKKIESEIDTALRDIGKLSEMLTSHAPFDADAAEIRERYQRLHNSDHRIWLDPEIRKLRWDFLNRCGWAMTRRKHYDDREDGEETRRDILDFAQKLAKRLTGWRG